MNAESNLSKTSYGSTIKNWPWWRHWIGGRGKMLSLGWMGCLTGGWPDRSVFTIYQQICPHLMSWPLGAFLGFSAPWPSYSPTFADHCLSISCPSSSVSLQNPMPSSAALCSPLSEFWDSIPLPHMDHRHSADSGLYQQPSLTPSLLRLPWSQLQDKPLPPHPRTTHFPWPSGITAIFQNRKTESILYPSSSSRVKKK